KRSLGARSTLNETSSATKEQAAAIPSHRAPGDRSSIQVSEARNDNAIARPSCTRRTKEASGHKKEQEHADRPSTARKCARKNRGFIWPSGNSRAAAASPLAKRRQNI